ncbi:MAG: restriction endonuclease subunit S [Desulfobacterales bacterium]
MKRIATTVDILGSDAPSRARQIVQTSDVLVSTVRPNLNAVASVPEELDGAIASTGFCVLRARKKLLVPRYLFFFTRTEPFVASLLQHVRGANYPAVTDRNVLDVRIPWPPLSEQQRIVEILDQADALRKKRAEADAKAARILPALFYKMFGDPATNPKGWPVKPIGEQIEDIERRDPSAQPGELFTYIDIAGVNGQIGVITDAKTLMGAEAPSRARQIVRVNDVIISTVRPYLRATALVPMQYDNQICSTGFCVLRAKAGIGFGFLYALSRLQWFTDQLNARARGASYPAVTDADVFNLRVPQPNDLDIHKSFDKRVLDVLLQQEKRREVADKIDNLFETLLHRAFTGDLTAQWREVHMKELLQEMEHQARQLNLRGHEA